jgi:hypothetical protein
MTSSTIKDISTTADRYKLFTLMCNSDKLSNNIAFIQSHYINVINIGKDLANYIDSLEDYKYLNIDVYDFTKKLLENNKAKINDSGNDVIAIYNLGILLEPALEINAVQLLKEFSKSASLVIIWENQSELPNRLLWPTQQQNFFLDFSDTTLKKLQYAI